MKLPSPAFLAGSGWAYRSVTHILLIGLLLEGPAMWVEPFRYRIGFGLGAPTTAQCSTRLKANPEILERRRELVEHPFGSIKQWMNQGAFPNMRLREGTHGIWLNGARDTI